MFKADLGGKMSAGSSWRCGWTEGWRPREAGAMKNAADRSDPEAPRARPLLVSLALSVLLALPFLGVSLLCFTPSSVSEWAHSATFTSKAWKDGDDSARYDMSWNLLHKEILAGKTPQEVEDLLGKPETRDVFDDNLPMPKYQNPHVERGVETWYYHLGPEKYNGSFGLVAAVLAVDFRAGKVFDVRKVIH
jgi:hypothetical protein